MGGSRAGPPLRIPRRTAAEVKSALPVGAEDSLREHEGSGRGRIQSPSGPNAFRRLPVARSTLCPRCPKTLRSPPAIRIRWVPPLAFRRASVFRTSGRSPDNPAMER